MSKPGHSLPTAERARLAGMKPADRFGRNGWSPIPHSFFTVLTSRMPSSWCMLVVVGYIMDRTFGVPERPEWVRISLSQLARMTGKRSQSFASALTEALRLGIIERRGSASNYEYRVWPEEWAGLPKYVEDESPIKPVAAADADAEPETAPAPVPSDTQVIASGKTAKAVVLQVSLAGAPEPVPLKFQTRNESGYELAVRTLVKPDGTVFATLLKGEEKANAQAGVPQSSLIAGLPKSLSPQQKSDLKMYVVSKSLSCFGKAPDSAFLDKVVKLSGSATVHDFAAIAEGRLRNKRMADTPGLFAEIAKDASKASKAAADLQQQEIARASEYQKQQNERFLREMRADYEGRPDKIAALRAADPEFAAELFPETGTAGA